MKKIGFFLAAALAFVNMAYGQSISAPDAMQRALAATGGGNVNSLELVSGGGIPVYRIVITNNAVRFDVSVNGNTGDILSLTSGGSVTTSASPPQPANPSGGSVWGSPSPPPRPPSSPSPRW